MLSKAFFYYFTHVLIKEKIKRQTVFSSNNSSLFKSNMDKIPLISSMLPLGISNTSASSLVLKYNEFSEKTIPFKFILKRIHKEK